MPVSLRNRKPALLGNLTAIAVGFLTMLVLAPAANPAVAAVPVEPGIDAYSENPSGSVPRDSNPSTLRYAGRATLRSARGPFLKGYAEETMFIADEPERSFWWDQSVRANTNIARINVPWFQVAPQQPADPTNPADPAYSWGNFDAAVVEAAERGQQIVLTLYHAPAWAEGPNRPALSDDALAGTWKPDPSAFGDFAQAVATRYSGQFPAPGPAALPRAQYLTAWNEPNLPEYLTPQSVRSKLFGPDHYRKLVNAFSAGVSRSANPNAKVVAGATSPYGDDSGGRTRPLRFLRDFLCLKENLVRQKKCSGGKPNLDILAHHPITLSGGPNKSAISPDDAAMPDFKHVVRTLRAAEKQNTVTGNRHPAWATEFWWETNPPDGVHGVPVEKHARWVQESLYSLWRQGASAAIWFKLVDDELGADGAGLQSGHFYDDRTEKPAFQAFRFPFVADRTSKKKVNFWTIAPADGTVEIQVKRGNDFKTIDRMSVRDGVPEQAKVTLGGKPPVRGVLNGEASITSNPG